MKAMRRLEDATAAVRGQDREEASAVCRAIALMQAEALQEIARQLDWIAVALHKRRGEEE